MPFVQGKIVMFEVVVTWHGESSRFLTALNRLEQETSTTLPFDDAG